MIKKKILFVLILNLVIITGSWAFAQTCPNIVGDWDATGEIVEHDPINGTYGYGEINGVVHITNQNGCLFYGYIEDPDDPSIGFTGVIRKRTVTITTYHAIMMGTLRGYNKTIGLYTRMIFTGSEWPSPPADWVASYKVIATRR